jgi:hypothetical protein
MMSQPELAVSPVSQEVKTMDRVPSAGEQRPLQRFANPITDWSGSRITSQTQSESTSLVERWILGWWRLARHTEGHQFLRVSRFSTCG